MAAAVVAVEAEAEEAVASAVDHWNPPDFPACGDSCEIVFLEPPPPRLSPP